MADTDSAATAQPRARDLTAADIGRGKGNSEEENIAVKRFSRLQEFSVFTVIGDGG